MDWHHFFTEVILNMGSCLLYGAISFRGNDLPFKVMRVMKGHKKTVKVIEGNQS